jgi:glucosamine kinase
MHGAACYLGIDGGGTATRARLVDAAGRILGEGRSGPSTLRLGVDAAWLALSSAADAAVAAAGVDSMRVRAAIGVAGLSLPGARAALQRRPHPYASLMIDTDAAMACRGAHAGHDGGIVIAGTGAIGFGLRDGQGIRLGGLGFPISDAGSGADIGLQAVRAVLCARDGLGPQTTLSAALDNIIGRDEATTAAWGSAATVTGYAALVPYVVQQAVAGDALASAILHNAAYAIGVLIDAMAAERVSRLSLLGGLASVLEPRLNGTTRARLSPPLGDGLDGAILVARIGAGA